MDFKQENFDLVIDPKTNDLGFDSDLANSILSQVIEAFDMREADDIDYPKYFSKQRESFLSDDPSDEYRRIVDAENILSRFDEIDSDSIEVELVEKKLQIQFRLKTGQVLRRLL